MRFLKVTILLAVIPAGIMPWHVLEAQDSSDPATEFFERRVRPVLLEHCVKCHGPKKQESGLRLDSREAVLRGGDSGVAAVESLTARGFWEDQPT